MGKLVPSRAAVRQATDPYYFFPHAANRLRSDINEVALRYDADNKVATLVCYRVSENSRIVVGKLYTASKVRAHEMLTFNGFYEWAEDRWRRMAAAV